MKKMNIYNYHLQFNYNFFKNIDSFCIYQIKKYNPPWRLKIKDQRYKIQNNFFKKYNGTIQKKPFNARNGFKGN